MKTALINTVLVAVMMLAGCQHFSETVTYTGSSESWSAEVVVHRAYGKESEDIIIKYLNEDFNKINSINYKLKATNWSTGQVSFN